MNTLHKTKANAEIRTMGKFIDFSGFNGWKNYAGVFRLAHGEESCTMAVHLLTSVGFRSRQKCKFLELKKLLNLQEGKSR